jgi:hypothetical protein
MSNLDLEYRRYCPTANSVLSYKFYNTYSKKYYPNNTTEIEHFVEYLTLFFTFNDVINYNINVLTDIILEEISDFAIINHLELPSIIRDVNYKFMNHNELIDYVIKVCNEIISITKCNFCIQPSLLKKFDLGILDDRYNSLVSSELLKYINDRNDALYEYVNKRENIVIVRNNNAAIISATVICCVALICATVVIIKK